MRRLRFAGYPPDYVGSLCLNDLFHEVAGIQDLRSVQLREMLHVFVSAAAVTADGGKAFKEMDEALSPRSAAPANAPDEAPKPRTLDDAEAMRIAASFAKANQFWSK
jgi:hypothetical protein